MPSNDKLSQGDNCATSKAHTNQKYIRKGWNGLTRAPHTNARRSPLHYCGDELPLQMGGASSTHHQGLWRSGKCLLEKNWHGCHVGVLTKNGAKFCKSLMNIINNQMHVKLITISPYHPQCNTLAKHFNLTISRKLARKNCSQNWLQYFD